MLLEFSLDMVLCSKRVSGITLLFMDKGWMSFFVFLENDMQCMITNADAMVYEWMQCIFYVLV
jgi:hypothetical protein